MKNGAEIVSDPDLGDVLSLEAPEAWILMGDFKGILPSISTCCRYYFMTDIIAHLSVDCKGQLKFTS